MSRRVGRAGAAGWASTLVVVAAVALQAPAAADAATVRYVDDDVGCDGQRPCYQTVQAAVDASDDGDTISVAAGLYVESALVVDKALIVEGPGIGSPTSPDDPGLHALWAQPGGTPAAALTFDARTRDVVEPSVSGFRFVSLTAGVRLLGRRIGDPAPLPVGVPPSTLDTAVVSATIGGNLLRAAGGAAAPVEGIAAWWGSGTRVVANRLAGSTVRLIGGSDAVVADNDVAGALGDGLALRVHGSDILLRNNTVDMPRGNGIRVEPLVGPGLAGAGERITITGNVVEGAHREGILVSVAQGGRLEGIALRGGRVERSGADPAAVVDGALAFVGADDRLSDASVRGLSVRDTVTGALGSRAGIHAEGVAGHLEVISTTVSDCGGPGLVSIDAHVLDVKASQLTRNAVGIQVVERTGRRETVVVGGAAADGNRLGGNRAGALVLVNDTGTSVSTSDVLATHNDWGTAVGPAIEDAIRHRPDDIFLGLVTVLPALAAPEVLHLDADPPAIVADGVSETRLTVRAEDLVGADVADDTLVVLRTNGGALDRPGRIGEAEGPSVRRWGEWGQYDSTQFGPYSGEGYLRSYDPGASLSWTFDAEAVLVRYGQAVLNTGTMAVELDGEALAPIDTRGPASKWVDRVIARGLGPGTHTITLTVTGGELNFDLLAAGTTTRDGRAEAGLRSGTSMGFGRVSARAYGANGVRDASLDVPFTAGQPSSLSVSVGAAAIPVGGITTTVTVTATDAIGRPVPDGTAIRLSAGLGTVAPEATVTRGGAAHATFRSGTRVGYAEIRAESGAAFALSGVRVVPGPPSTLAVSASRAAIPANSRDTTEITVAARDAFDNAVADGTTVRLATDLGTLDATAPTTSEGVATTRLRSGNTAGTAQVRADVGSISGTVAVAFAATDLRLTKSVEPLSAVVPGESVTFTLSYANAGPGAVYDVIIDDVLPTGLISPVVRTPPGQRVERLVDRPLGFRLERLNQSQSGDIFVTLKVDTSLLWGPRTVVTNTATAASALAAERTPHDNTDAAPLVILPGAVYTVTVTAPAQVTVGGATGRVRARLTDRYGNPARDGTAVAFSTDLGTIAPPLATTRDGVAEATLVSGTRSGTATVRAVTLEERGATARVRIAPGPPSRLALATGRDWLTVGGETTVLTATVADQYGNGVPATVGFETDLGLLSRREVAADATGSATTTLRSSVHTGTATVTARSGALWQSRAIPFRAAEPAGVELALTDWRLHVGATTAAAASVFDRFGNPVPGRTVEFTSNIATVRNARVETDADGRAETVLTAHRPGSGVVRAATDAYTAVRVLTVDAGRSYLPIALR